MKKLHEIFDNFNSVVNLKKKSGFFFFFGTFNGKEKRKKVGSSGVAFLSTIMIHYVHVIIYAPRTPLILFTPYTWHSYLTEPSPPTAVTRLPPKLQTQFKNYIQNLYYISLSLITIVGIYGYYIKFKFISISQF